MSSLEKFYLRGALALILAYVAFLWTVTIGGSPADLSPNKLLVALFAYGLVLALALAVLWVWTMKADGPNRHRADEREAQIEAKADRVGYRVLEAGLFGLTMIVILKMGASSGSSRLEDGATLVLALVSLSALAGLARMGAGFVAARRG